MNVDLIIAMIMRREQSARDRAASLDKDPSLRASAQQNRAVANAMKALRQDIIDNREPEDRNTA